MSLEKAQPETRMLPAQSGPSATGQRQMAGQPVDSHEPAEFNLRSFFPYLVRVFYRAVSSSVSEVYASRYGLSVSEWRTMAVLGPQRAMSATEIVEQSSMDKVNVSRAIKGLRRAGYLRRDINGDDRRRAVVRLTSQDAGGVLRSAEFLRNASGGDFQVDLVPIGEADFDGKLQIKNVRIQDAPAFAELLNAISVVGLLDQLGGEGILFNEVESQFRLSPNRVTVIQASAVGPSMGISADGIYSTGNKVFDIQGVISPLYVLNAIGRPIARKGEGLFGFNYSLTGASDSLVVRVNPLSVLTPGIFRNIFRRPPPEPEAESQ